MKILRAIGAFFVKIGRWIKDTAWVQPLLIVGGIFAIIFSIKPISDAISGMFKGGSASEDYYSSLKLSLKDADKTENGKTGYSQADELFSFIENPTENNKFGQKFYISFVSKGCENCDACYPGFKLFQENFNKTSAYTIDDGKVGDGFKLYTIFCDEKNDKDEMLIDDLLRNHSNFFENLFGSLNDVVSNEKYPYYVNTTDKATFTNNIDSFIKCIGATAGEDDVSVPTPTTFLVDLTPAGDSEKIYGDVTEVFFNYSVDADDQTDYGKSYLLRDSWNYKGKFSSDYRK